MKTFKRKFNKLRNTLSPATRVLLDPMPASSNLEDIKANIKMLTDRLKKLEMHFHSKNNETTNQTNPNEVSE